MRQEIEWPTLGLLLATYAVWALATTLAAEVSLWLAVPAAAVAIAMHSSLTHEVIHGHPFRNRRLSAVTVFPALTLVIPFFRFRDTHLAHHLDCELTDPYDDPESNFLDAGDWERLPRWLQRVLDLNNTLAGRLLVGPLVGTTMFLISEARALRRDPRVRSGWLWHLPMVLPVVLWVWWAPMPFWAYALAAYGGLSLLRIRTFLEHRAHEARRGRSVIVEDRGPLALLFLNNNLHVVHHMHPAVPWYRLPVLFRENRERYLKANGGYYYRSYAEVFRRYLATRKDPVAHPLWRRG